MENIDRETESPLQAIFGQHGMPTHDMAGVEAAKDFADMLQHQSPEFRQAVLPKLKLNVDAVQANAGTYAMVYDRTQRDQGKCSSMASSWSACPACSEWSCTPGWSSLIPQTCAELTHFHD